MTWPELDDRLDEWVDGALPAAAAAEVESHLAACPLCQQREQRLRQLLAHAAALPRAVAPERDLWPAIARRVERERAWSWRLGGWSPVGLAAAATVAIIGYDRAAEIARAAAESGRTVRELCVERGVLPPDELARLLDPRSMTGR